MAVTIQLKRGKKATWENLNPILADGEPGYERETGKLKIGDGETAWKDLKYFTEDYSVSVDGKSVTFSNSQIELMGFRAASANQFPIKNSEGYLAWVDKDTPMTEQEIESILNEGVNNNG